VEAQGHDTTLTLVTADRALRPSTEQVVVATLRGEGIQAPGPLPLPPASQQPGKTTHLGGWQWILLWGQLFLATIIGACYLYRLGWSAAVTYLLTTPLLMMFGFLFFSAIDSLVPPTL